MVSGHRSGISPHGSSQDIEELADARLQLAISPPSQDDYVPMLHSDLVFHVLDPRCRKASQYLARHTSRPDGFECQGKRVLFAYDTREVCEADPIGCPRPLRDFSVHGPSTNTNEPHQAQDLGGLTVT